MALLGIIRRWYIRDHISIREIARRLDISRNTVRRYIRSDAIEPAYPARHSPSSLDEFAPRLSAWLSAESVKSRKQRRTLKQMFLDLKELGYEGSYDRVAAFGRRWKAGQMERVKSASKSTVTSQRQRMWPGRDLLILRNDFSRHRSISGGEKHGCYFAQIWSQKS
ncbi:HTH domain-containing protein [Herbaspirillum seropedicae]|uniref:HTH domain-containing protein n=1 Tax=Herbaspirillum seropedicae TaxID=964 RepID=UPI003D958715